MLGAEYTVTAQRVSLNYYKVNYNHYIVRSKVWTVIKSRTDGQNNET